MYGSYRLTRIEKIQDYILQISLKLFSLLSAQINNFKYQFFSIFNRSYMHSQEINFIKQS